VKRKEKKRNAESLWTVCQGTECSCNAAVVLGVITFVLCAELYSILAIFSFHIYSLQSVSRLIPSVDLFLRKGRYQMGVSFIQNFTIPLATCRRFPYRAFWIRSVCQQRSAEMQVTNTAALLLHLSD